MSDLVWFIIIGALFVLLSLIFIILGLQIWKKQKMDLIISYHCDKVSEDNKRAYCVLSGIGLIIMGAGFGLSGLLAVFLRSASVFIPMTVGLGSGIALLTAAGIRYNR
jgi:hypothetical protein